jgi:uracil-DNA glycosylase
MKLTKQFWVDKLGEGWTMQMKDLLRSPYSQKLIDFLGTEYALNDCVPLKSDVFNAFKLCSWEEVKIVIIGPEPHSMGGANGLAYGNGSCMFNTNTICRIYECIEREYRPGGFYLEFDFSLENWAKQGVLLLNMSLTTRTDSPGSHKKPWGKFISEVLNQLNNNKSGIIFIFWTEESKAIIPHIDPKHYVLSNVSPIGAPEYKWECSNFKEANEILKKRKKKEINW